MTSTVRPDHPTETLINHDAAGRRIAAATGADAWKTFTAELISGGKSNLTFELRSDAGTLILRRPPTGTLLPSAHDMAREAKIQTGLKRHSDVPVPAIISVDGSGDDMGVPYYVMERAEGHVIRDSLPAGYAESDEDKTSMANAIADVLAALHSVDPDAVGLGDLGKKTGYLDRQLRRWLGQSEKADESVRAPELPALAAQLRSTMPPEREARITHGDFRMDNCVFDELSPRRIRAVLDWELSTLGDPIADLALSLLYWGDKDWPEVPLVPSLTREPGWPGAGHVQERYCDVIGTEVGNLDWYLAFSAFKFAAIAQGVATRAEAGDMAGQHFGDLGGQIRDLVDLGRSLL